MHATRWAARRRCRYGRRSPGTAHGWAEPPPGAVFYAIPLENRPTWRNPPWMTVLLILLNMAVFWGPQRPEEKAQDKAVAFYLTSKLPALEIPPFVAWLEAHDAPRAKIAKALQRRGAD